MKNLILFFDKKKEVKKIVSFLKKTFQSQRKEKAVIGVSGGIDSAVSLILLSKALNNKNIFVYHLYYFSPKKEEIYSVIKKTKIPAKNIFFISIKEEVDRFSDRLKIEDKLRKGNLMARVRMIILFDQAKKLNALVCGTENKSEYLLGYFTRFGDQASDIEPIIHLYKTQVFQIAKYLKLPQGIIEKKPSADLWEDQSDEKELGFSYSEADPVLYLFFEKNFSLDKIKQLGYQKAEKIIEYAKKNNFKKITPYSLIQNEPWLLRKF